jgi:hypothetical protein
MTNDQIFNMKDASYFMRHAQNIEQDTENNFDIEIDAPIVVAQIHLADKLATYINDEFEMEEPISFHDLLDALSSIGIVMSSIDDDSHRHNYASLAYFYSLNNQSIPEVSEYLAQ